MYIAAVRSPARIVGALRTRLLQFLIVFKWQRVLFSERAHSDASRSAVRKFRGGTVLTQARGESAFSCQGEPAPGSFFQSSAFLVRPPPDDASNTRTAGCSTNSRRVTRPDGHLVLESPDRVLESSEPG